MNKNNFTEKVLYKELSPHWITGFSDAESYFSIRISKRQEAKRDWVIRPIFSIELHERDFFLLERIKFYFKVGTIYKRRSHMVVYQVQSRKDINNFIIPHFEKYPLLTKKRNDFLLFKLILDLLNNKVHTSFEGIQRIINLRASMNKGLSDKLIKAFPDTIPYPEITFNNYDINPYWLTGFVDGEGCFYIKSRNKNKGFGAFMLISQHSRDEILFRHIVNYLNCGLIEKPSTRLEVSFRVYSIKDIYEKIMPFFEKYPLESVKLLDFLDFYKVAKILYEQPGKLSEENFNLIHALKVNMNRGRKIWK